MVRIVQPQPQRSATRVVRDLVFAVFRLNGTIIERGDALVEDLGLTSSLWQLLDHLDRSSVDHTVSGVARLMGMTRQSVQRNADILAARGFVTFQTNPHHRRAKLMRLTASGSEALRRATERQEPLAETLLGTLGVERVAAVLALVREMDDLIHADSGKDA